MQTRNLVIIAVVIVIGLFAGSVSLIQPEVYQLSLLGSSPQGLEEVHRFRLEIEFTNGDQLGMGFHDEERDEDDVAIVVRKTGENKERIAGEQAQAEINALVRRLPTPTNSKPLELIQGVLASLDIPEKDIEEFELGMELATGDRVRIDLEVHNHRED